MLFWFAYSFLTLTYSKGKRQGHVTFRLLISHKWLIYFRIRNRTVQLTHSCPSRFCSICTASAVKVLLKRTVYLLCFVLNKKSIHTYAIKNHVEQIIRRNLLSKTYACWVLFPVHLVYVSQRPKHRFAYRVGGVLLYALCFMYARCILPDQCCVLNHKSTAVCRVTLLVSATQEE